MPAQLVPFSTGLCSEGLLPSSPFERVAFPKVGKPLIQTISEEEFEKLLHACVLSQDDGRYAERATARNRAILMLLYDTGIRVSELTNMRLGDLDRKHGLIVVKGKGSKERRIALGQTCLRTLLHYLDRHRPDEKEMAEWGQPGGDHLFLSETRKPLTKNSMTLLFARLKKRAGITGKRISPHIFRHTFAIRYLVLGNDPFSLQALLGHEDMTTVKNYMHMNDQTIQDQKRKYSPSDHFSGHLPESREMRRRGFEPKGSQEACSLNAKTILSPPATWERMVPLAVLSNESFEPIGKINKLHLAWRLRAIKGIGNDDVTKFCQRIGVAIHTIEQIKKKFKLPGRIASRTRAKGFQQAFLFGR